MATAGAARGRLDILQCLYAAGWRDFAPSVLEATAWSGDLPVVQYLISIGCPLSIGAWECGRELSDREVERCIVYELFSRLPPADHYMSYYM